MSTSSERASMAITIATSVAGSLVRACPPAVSFEDLKSEAIVAILAADAPEDAREGWFYRHARWRVLDYLRAEWRRSGREIPSNLVTLLNEDGFGAETAAGPATGLQRAVEEDHAEAAASRIDAERVVDAIFDTEVLTDQQKMLLKVLYACSGDRKQAAVDIGMTDAAFRKNLERIRTRLAEAGLGEGQ